MLCLIISGTINVIFNIIFVKEFSMGVAGVAIATVISQIVSAVMIIFMLKRSCVGLSVKKIKFDGKILKNTIKIGVPAGIQGMVFSLSNIITVSAVNSFGAAAAAANTVAGNIEGIIYVALNSITQTVTTFASQNIGAKKIYRLNPIMLRGLLITTVGGIALSLVSYIFKDVIIDIFAPGDEHVAELATIKFIYVIIPYFTVGLMEIPAGMLRGMDETFIAMVMSIMGVCVFRIVWQLFIFPLHRTLEFLYISYPISWIGTGIVYMIAYIILKKKLEQSVAMGKESLAV